ncbi:hypothetical protein [Alicyclobacillus sp. SO9]|uniref:hypothetical protein n=1 Tax=Alicyclobacillus sp. SO9 TaxID=2665646 RepID=UPI0018E6E508|nr:hypothetical protein [Alicyclobacillus sp. SO9]QQE77443.1 hypothetical protein GI364_16005 [Alicyclobacillus sp. SO9]
MPAFIAFGVINANSPQQNSGIFIGQVNVTGWDANQKLNFAHGSNFGPFSLIGGTISNTIDSFEWIDGVINDQDMKIAWNMNI